MLMGLLLGAAMAIWVDRKDKRVRSAVDATVAGIPVLATMASRDRGMSRPRGVVSADGAEVREFIERLRTVTLASAAPPSAIAIAAIEAEVAAYPVAAELSAALAKAGYRVSLVVTDPSAALPMGPDHQDGTGLADALNTLTSVRDYLRQMDDVCVLPAGRGLREQSSKLSSRRFREIITELRADFDYVVLLAPPAANAAGTGVAVMADSVILVGVEGQTSREEVDVVLRCFRQVNIDVIGLAMVARGFTGRSSNFGAGSDVGMRTSSASVAPVPAEDAEPQPVTRGLEADPAMGTERERRRER